MKAKGFNIVDPKFIRKGVNSSEAKKAWEGFRKDPEWVKAKEASEVNGVLTAKVDSIYMEATDYSAMK